ncbi:MAG: chalcone isomerase family protein [Bdellovibrionales bacterium]|nr:chalcone isomerase family protein [Bdellovibrionales bacterium]
MKLFIVGFITLLTGIYSQAEILTKELSQKKIEGVTLASKATVKLDDGSIILNSVSAGVRLKKVLFIKVNVYVAELFVSEESPFVKAEDKVIDSLVHRKAAVMQLTFLRDVGVEKVKSSFEEALKLNGVDTGKAEIKKILESVVTSGDIKKNQTLTFVSHELKGETKLTYESNTGLLTQVSGSDTAKDIFKMWLGKTTDNELENLKKELLK